MVCLPRPVITRIQPCLIDLVGMSFRRLIARILNAGSPGP